MATITTIAITTTIIIILIQIFLDLKVTHPVIERNTGIQLPGIEDFLDNSRPPPPPPPPAPSINLGENSEKIFPLKSLKHNLSFLQKNLM